MANIKTKTWSISFGLEVSAGHVNTMAESVRRLLTRIPADQLKPGDQLISNDPWHTAGHLHDLTVVAPALRRGDIVGYFGTC